MAFFDAKKTDLTGNLGKAGAEASNWSKDIQAGDPSGFNPYRIYTAAGKAAGAEGWSTDELGRRIGVKDNLRSLAGKAVDGLKDAFGGGGGGGAQTPIREVTPQQIDLARIPTNYRIGGVGAVQGLGQAIASAPNSLSPAAAQVANPAQIAAADLAAQAAARDQQNALLSQLMAQSRGEGPSLAQAQLNQGLSRNLAAIQAQQASMRNGGALGARTALMAGQQARNDINQQAALARIQEQLNAQQGAAGLATGLRGQDLGVAQLEQGRLSGQAQLNQQAALAQAQLSQEAAQANAGRMLQFGQQDVARQLDMARLGLQRDVEQGRLDNESANRIYSAMASNANLNMEAQRLGQNRDIAIRNLALQKQAAINQSRGQVLGALGSLASGAATVFAGPAAGMATSGLVSQMGAKRAVGESNFSDDELDNPGVYKNAQEV